MVACPGAAPSVPFYPSYVEEVGHAWVDQIDQVEVRIDQEVDPYGQVGPFPLVVPFYPAASWVRPPERRPD